MMAWTEEQQAKLEQLAEAGYSSAEIAEFIGSTKSAVLKRCARTGVKLNPGRPTDEDLSADDLFVYDEPGYYIDRTGDRWLVGEDADGDLVGINVLHEDPTVQYWDPCGRVRQGVKRGHARDLIGPYRAKRSGLKGADLAMAFHRSN